MRTVAIVPMRAGSERVPGKNKRLLDGKPLYRWVLDALAEVPELDEVQVWTDDQEIDCHRLPAEVANGSMNDAIAYILAHSDGDLFLQTHATNPFVFPCDFSAALARWRQAPPEADCLLSVGPLQQKRFWYPDGTPVNHNPQALMRTQDLAGIYEENSCIYIFPRNTVERFGGRIGACPVLYPMPSTLDIDTELDWNRAVRYAEGGKC
jgi:CMP-N-acetylneuraminic acid synthetase